MRKINFIFLGFVFFFAAAMPFSVSLSRFEARVLGEEVNVFWQVNDEQTVREYVLERKAQYDVGFKEIKRQTSDGRNRLYQFRDTDLYKATVSEQVQYRIRIVEKDGNVTTSNVLNANYTPTAVRRTWGSIKAMFE
jgi:hypothetical protein